MNNDCLQNTIKSLSDATHGLVLPGDDKQLRQEILKMYDPSIRDFMKPEIMRDNQIGFDTFMMYWSKKYPDLKLVCFIRYLVPFNERKGDRYVLEKKVLNEECGGQFICDYYVILTTDKKGTGAGHYKLVRGDDVNVLMMKLKSEDII
jgi:hypothetical protein